MTNKEKFKEVFEKTFGFVPEDCMPCPEKCPEEFKNKSCYGCTYDREYPNQEYKEQEKKKDSFLFEVAEIFNNIHNLLEKNSPIPEYELITMICVFMDIITDDNFNYDFDLGVLRHDLAEKIYNEWPHPIEYYKKGR